MSLAALEILYESEFLRVVTNGLESTVRFVSFNHLFYGKPDKSFWGDGFFAKYNFAAIGFVSPNPDWFPEDDMQHAVAAVRAELARAPGQRLVSYGVSMGGYAALKYAALVGADAAIAFSPQISINPADVARFDPRYIRYYDSARNRDMRIRSEDLAAENYVLYDKFWTVDRKHAEQIAALGPVTRFALPFTGHASVRSIAEGRIAQAFLLRLLDAAPGKAAALRGMVRRTRRSTLVYWESRAVSLTGRRPAATRLILDAVQNALVLAPNAVIWQLALVMALLNCAERDEAEWELAKIHLSGQSPIGQWVRYIDCHRRIHGDAATIEMMGRAPPDLQSQAPFRFEDAVIRFDMGDVASAAAILALIWPEQEQIGRRMKLGILLSATGEKEKALGVFRALAEEAPTAEHLLQLASALAEDRTNPAARTEALTRLAEARAVIDPDPMLWPRLLLLYDRLGAPAEQIAAGREAVAALPGYPDLRMELAIALERGGEHAEALALARRLIPEQARIRRRDWLILMVRKGGMSAEALALAHAVAAEHPDDSASRLQLAVLLLEQDQEAEAFAHLLYIRAHPTGRLDLMEDAVKAFDAVGLNADAAKAAGRLATNREDQLAPQLLFADRLVRAGFSNEARILLRRVRRHVGDDPASLCLIASRYRQAGDGTRAEELFARALEPDQRGAEPEANAAGRDGGWRALAQMELLALQSQHGGRRGLGAARRSAAELAESNSKEPGFWAGLADLFATLDQPSRGLAAIGKATALAPDEATHRLREAELLLAAGKRSDARARLTALAASGAARETFARAVALLEQTEDSAAVRRVAERRLAASPQDPAALLALARSLLKAGEKEAARARLAEAMERRAGAAAFWSAIGDLYLDLRDWPEARLAAERAIANDPGNAKRAEQIVGLAGLMSNRASPPAVSRRAAPAVRRAGLFSRLAGTFFRS